VAAYMANKVVYITSDYITCAPVMLAK